MWMSVGHPYTCTNCRKRSQLLVSLKKSVLLQGIGGSISGTTFHFLIWRFRVGIAFSCFAVAAFFISFSMAWASARLTPLKEEEPPKPD